MDEPLGAVAKRKRQTRIKVEVAILVLLVISSIIYVVFTIDTQETRGAVEIVMGPGAELKAAFIGPSELQIKWDNVTGHEWSVALIEGRIRNISSKTVEFEDIIYRVKDKQGRIIWQESDARFTNGGKLEIMEYFNFVAHPMSKRDSERFEVVVASPEIIKR